MNKILITLFLFFFCINCNAQIIQDDFVNETLSDVEKPFVNEKYNYESWVKIPIKLRIIEEIKSEKDVYEGQIIKFRVKRNVRHNDNLLIARETVVPAKVKVITTSGMNGIPASIILGDFEIKGITPNQLTNEVEIFGQDRSLWVFPLKWALTPFPPTGSLTNFIMGGKAKIKANRTIAIYYYPEN